MPNNKKGVAKTGTPQTACCVAKNKCTAACTAGYKDRSGKSDIICAGEGAGTCDNDRCCELDDTKCLGAGHTCDSGTYMPANKYGVAKTGTPQTACCVAKNKCSQACPAGYKDKQGKADIICPGDGAGTCVTDTCCDPDPDTCNGIAGVSCPTNYYKDPSKIGQAATAGNKNTVCCTEKTECALSVCTDVGTRRKLQVCTAGSNGAECSNCDCCESNPTVCGSISAVACKNDNHFWDSGKKMDVFTDPSVSCCSQQGNCGAYGGCTDGLKKSSDTPAQVFCTGGTGGTCTTDQCCTKDATTCFGGDVVCDSGTYMPNNKKGVAKTGTPQTACCVAKNKCTAACTAGYKDRSGKSDIICAGEGAGTCDNDRCCELDDTKCLGAGHTCDSGTYMPANKYGVAKTGTPQTACCVAKNKCSQACPAGYKDKQGKADIICPGDGAGTCVTDTCCDPDPDTCKGIGGVVCMAPYYFNTGSTAAATEKTKNTVCCSAPLTCETSNTAVTEIEVCPTPAPSAGGGGSGGGTGGGSGSGISSGGLRVVPTLFVTSLVLATQASVK